MERFLNPIKLLSKNSYFLIGPRGVGKSFLIRRLLSPTIDYIDLLKSETYLRLNVNPGLLENFIQSKRVVIDEIQRIPLLLNEVHRLIELKKNHFLLTGSSSRKLRRGGVNLLAGRAFRAELFPLTWYELQQKKQFDLAKYLLVGGLPRAYLEDHSLEFLYSYVDTYLREEIQAESFVRNLSHFARFLEQAATCNTEIINFTKVANDAQLPPNTVRDYYLILEDTLVGYLLAPWRGSHKRKAVASSKFYFFDPGVVHAICGLQTFDPHSNHWGKAFEHFLLNEIRAYLSYSQIRHRLYFWRSVSGFEVDFVVGDDVAIEVKSGTHMSEREHRGLKAIGEEKKFRWRILISQDRQAMTFQSGIIHLFWEDFLRQLWAGKIVE